MPTKNGGLWRPKDCWMNIIKSHEQMSQVETEARAHCQAVRCRLMGRIQAPPTPPVIVSEQLTTDQQAMAIIDQIGWRWGFTTAEIISRERHHNMDLARAEAIVRMRVRVGMKWAQIGRLLGGRSGTTIKRTFVMHIKKKGIYQ